MGSHGLVVLDDGLDTIIRWNGKSTFNLYRDGQNLDCFWVYEVDTLPAARKAAADWYANNH